MISNFNDSMFKPTRMFPKLQTSPDSENVCFSDNCFCKNSNYKPINPHYSTQNQEDSQSINKNINKNKNKNININRSKTLKAFRKFSGDIKKVFRINPNSSQHSNQPYSKLDPIINETDPLENIHATPIQPSFVRFKPKLTLETVVEERPEPQIISAGTFCQQHDNSCSPETINDSNIYAYTYTDSRSDEYYPNTFLRSKTSEYPSNYNYTELPQPSDYNYDYDHDYECKPKRHTINSSGNAEYLKTTSKTSNYNNSICSVQAPQHHLHLPLSNSMNRFPSSRTIRKSGLSSQALFDNENGNENENENENGTGNDSTDINTDVYRSSSTLIIQQSLRRQDSLLRSHPHSYLHPYPHFYDDADFGTIDRDTTINSDSFNQAVMKKVKRYSQKQQLS